ncbi:nitrate ABC transporter substrate-binding protein [Burkholderia sp. SRS-W-2-2016]|uniref:ABC transporter substrate-binding protein n=1 Tax=Burkholderia sp. SRS-W-2-2016 TaxID=1926878 RepID=UPI00094AE78A|nr:ABC transporter substrate-binding protein [Burkholderia sp. SRS-W-2-2016]OLL29225.1 nitrate ABC transporter substrate-binding protein [Burkholderia sp. SRS-W-2-2016]
MLATRRFARTICLTVALAATVAGPAFAPSAQAAPLTVTHWGDGMYGVPFAVALEKGFFKEQGVDVTGFITSEGGGTTVRNAMASEIPYGEVALPAAISAIKQGVDLTIVHGGVQSLADLVWVQPKSGTITGIKQMKGKTMGYSSPKSTTDTISTIALDRAGLTGQVQRKPVGSSSGMLTSLQQGAIDAGYMTEPAFSEKKDIVKIAFRASDVVPNETQTVGVVRTDYLKAHPEVIRGIILARRKAVQYIAAHRDESAQIVARQYKMDPKVALSAISDVLDNDPKYWSEGSFDMASMDEVLKGLILVKAIPAGPFDWSKIIDQSQLPADLRSKG